MNCPAVLLSDSIIGLLATPEVSPNANPIPRVVTNMLLEHSVALYELLEENHFLLPACPHCLSGPWPYHALHLKVLLRYSNRTATFLINNYFFPKWTKYIESEKKFPLIHGIFLSACSLNLYSCHNIKITPNKKWPTITWKECQCNLNSFDDLSLAFNLSF